MTGVVREGLVPNPKLRLRDQVREVMRFKHYSRRTEELWSIRNSEFEVRLVTSAATVTSAAS